MTEKDELRSWSAGDPEPPEDVTLLRYTHGSLPHPYLRRSDKLDDGSPGWVVEMFADPREWSSGRSRLWERRVAQTKAWGPLVEVLPETPTPTPCAFPGCSRWAKEPDGLCDNIQHWTGPPVSVVQDDTPATPCECCATNDNPGMKRGRCGRCDHSIMSHVSCPETTSHLVDQVQVDQVNKVLTDLRGEVHGLRSCVDNLKDLYNLDSGVTTEILEHVALQQQKRLTAALALVEEMSLHLRQDVALRLGVESRLAELREGTQG